MYTQQHCLLSELTVLASIPEIMTVNERAIPWMDFTLYVISKCMHGDGQYIAQSLQDMNHHSIQLYM